MLFVLSPFFLYSFPLCPLFFSFFFFNDTATTEIYTLSLHDALPISRPPEFRRSPISFCTFRSATKTDPRSRESPRDRKSTRLNSSHQIISYAVFCLKKKKRCVRIRTYDKQAIHSLQYAHCARHLLRH